MGGNMSCTMCGARFEAAENLACSACPLKRGGELVCCPACGYKMVDPEQSSLARAAGKLFGLRMNRPNWTMSEQRNSIDDTF